MPETPEEFHRRAAPALRTPPLDDWDTWPFEPASLRPKTLRPPEPEPAIAGAGGVGCRACSAPDEEYLWSDDRWRLLPVPEPAGLPVVVLLEPRAHFSSMADLPEDLARECGVMLGRVERAVLAVGGIGKVHIGRWGEGADHLHWWFIARPEGFAQLRSSFAAIWDDVLPPTPQAVWDDSLARVVQAMDDTD